MDVKVVVAIFVFVLSVFMSKVPTAGGTPSNTFLALRQPDTPKQTQITGSWNRHRIDSTDTVVKCENIKDNFDMVSCLEERLHVKDLEIRNSEYESDLLSTKHHTMDSITILEHEIQSPPNNYPHATRRLSTFSVSTQTEFTSALQSNAVIEMESNIVLVSALTIMGKTGVIVHGNGHSVDGNNLVRCFVVQSSEVAMHNLTITRGLSTSTVTNELVCQSREL
jgi:hypothetical protein